MFDLPRYARLSLSKFRYRRSAPTSLNRLHRSASKQNELIPSVGADGRDRGALCGHDGPLEPAQAGACWTSSAGSSAFGILTASSRSPATSRSDRRVGPTRASRSLSGVELSSANFALLLSPIVKWMVSHHAAGWCRGRTRSLLNGRGAGSHHSASAMRSPDRLEEVPPDWAWRATARRRRAGKGVSLRSLAYGRSLNDLVMATPIFARASVRLLRPAVGLSTCRHTPPRRLKPTASPASQGAVAVWLHQLIVVTNAAGCHIPVKRRRKHPVARGVSCDSDV